MSRAHEWHACVILICFSSLLAAPVTSQKPIVPSSGYSYWGAQVAGNTQAEMQTFEAVSHSCLGFICLSSFQISMFIFFIIFLPLAYWPKSGGAPNQFSLERLGSHHASNG